MARFARQFERPVEVCMDITWEYTEIYASLWKEELHIRIMFPDGGHKLYESRDLLSVLNELGEDGWELVSAMGRGRRAGEGDFAQIFYLKRQGRMRLRPGSGPLRGTR